MVIIASVFGTFPCFTGGWLTVVLAIDTARFLSLLGHK